MDDLGALRSQDRSRKTPRRYGFDGGRDRDRTCDPYHVKKVHGIEAVANQGIRVAVCGNGGKCSKDVPPPVVAYDQRALPITGIPGAAVSSGS
jgi:hypothetical protein